MKDRYIMIVKSDLGGTLAYLVQAESAEAAVRRVNDRGYRGTPMMITKTPVKIDNYPLTNQRLYPVQITPVTDYEVKIG